jgi:hypothetical protein
MEGPDAVGNFEAAGAAREVNQLGHVLVSSNCRVSTSVGGWTRGGVGQWGDQA